MPLPVRRRENAPQPQQRWDPLSQLEGLHEQMGQLVQNAWATDGRVEAAPQALVPLVDIEETDDAWIVEAELPGVRREDVDVEVRGNELSITAAITEREREGVLRRRTRRIGEFDYHITLPGEMDPENVDATLDNGVLMLRIPKADVSRSKRVQVK
jgi:HSP20 family protein